MDLPLLMFRKRLLVNVVLSALDTVELSLSRQLGIELGLLEFAGVLGLDIAMDLVDISHVALGAVFALDITDTLVDTRAAESSHFCRLLVLKRREKGGGKGGG